MAFHPLTYSILFISIFAVYFFFAVYIYHINEKALLNRAFFLVCAAICTCMLGLALSLMAPDAYMALFWRRCAAVGWSAVYCLSFIFLLILTGKEYLLKKWWFDFIICLPAALNIYVFSISGKMASQEYLFVPSYFGWSNLNTNSFWDILFYLINFAYCLAATAIVWHWKKKSPGRIVSKQANLIITTILIPLIIGTVSKIMLLRGFDPILQLMVPVIIFLPATAFYYIVSKYGLMSPKKLISSQVIMNEQTRRRLYLFITAFFILFALLSFLYELLQDQTSLLDAAYNSAVLIFIGTLLFSIQRIKKEALRYSLNTVIVLLSIPLVSILFIEYGTVSSLMFPIVLTIFSFVFNRPAFLISVSIATALTQFFVWIYTQDGPFRLTVYDFLARLVFYAVVFLLGLYINKIYVAKLKENSFQIELQKLISDISYDFACVNTYNADKTINRMLERTGSFYKADRSFIFLFDHEQNVMNIAYEWCGEGITPELGLINPCPLYKYPQWIDEMADHKTVYQLDVRKLPEDFIKQNNMFIDKSIITLISAPIETNGTMYGFIGFSSVRSPLIISDSNLEILQTFANLLADKFMMLKAEFAIERLAFYDQMTGLPNRLLFNDRAAQAIHLAKRKAKFLGFVFMDLDSFKVVNDTMGHTGGDEIIREVARMLSRHIRKSDTVARFGGDEFLILLNDISDCNQIQKIAENIMKLFEAPIRLHDQEYFITASAGISIYPVDGDDCDTLIKNADNAMYKAKAGGTKQFVMCTAEMKEEVLSNMMLSNSLYRALERGELTVYYQPQVNLNTGAVIGLEALVRWNHPQLGMISPGLFIPLAEKNGLISSIGEWVLKTACNQNKAWQEMGLPRYRMSVNVSALQFRNPRLVETVEMILRDTGLSPEDLDLEITESAAIKETTYIIDILKNLKRLGVSISIDDFGTEYSSLTRLKDLPIDRIKIDIQFIRGLDTSEKDQAITMIIINLAKNLGLQVIAEGVESETQLRFLKVKDCDEVQGYYFFKPMPPEQLIGLLRSTGV